MVAFASSYYRSGRIATDRKGLRTLLIAIQSLMVSVDAGICPFQKMVYNTKLRMDFLILPVVAKHSIFVRCPFPTSSMPKTAFTSTPLLLTYRWWS